MKKIKYLYLLCCMLIQPAMALNSLTPRILIPASPQLTAEHYLLMDYDSGRLLASRNLDERIVPASLTKMMTMYVVNHELQRQNLKKTDLVRISRRAWRAEGTRMFLEPNTQVKVEDIIKGIVITSGNDASIAIAEHIAGSEEAFAGLMNSYAEMLGMTGTHFKNATGLTEEGHYSTVRDLATLARALIKHFPHNYALHAKKQNTYNGIKQTSRNKLLWRNQYVDGLKTGYTDKAGYCLAASARKQNMRLVSVVMGTKSDEARINETQKLLTWGFRFFETHKRYETGQTLDQPKVLMGQKRKLDIGLSDDMYITVERGYGSKVTERLTLTEPLTAPIALGAEVGMLEIQLNGRTIAEQPLVALDTIQIGGYFTRMIDYTKLTLQQFMNKMSA